MNSQGIKPPSFRVMSITPVLNEEQRIGPIIQEMPHNWVDLAVVINDGSSDRTAAAAQDAGAEVLTHPTTMGVGAAIRTGLLHAIALDFDAVVITSGSGKTRSSEVPRLVQALVEKELDLAQGSRYMPGGCAGNMPIQRVIGTHGYSICFSLLAGRRITDASSGFRAIRTSFLKDSRIRVEQEWLNRYELEPYLLFKAITLGYQLQEVPVTIEYPPPIAGVPYTRIRAIVDWWRLLRPIVFLRLGLKS